MALTSVFAVAAAGRYFLGDPGKMETIPTLGHKRWETKIEGHTKRNCQLTYLPHKAVAEVSRDKEPIGRGCVEFKWFESQLMSDSSEVRFK